MSEERDIIVKRLRAQAEACRFLGSDLYAYLLERATEDAAAEGPTYEVLEPFARVPEGGALALKLMGAVHRLVLENRAPELARFYPSAGGHEPIEEAWEPFLRVLIELRDAVTANLERSVQTNEVGRSAALLGGFLEVAGTSSKPLKIVEIGSSAGLNLRWDHYRYEADGRAWGPPGSPVVLEGFAEPPPFDVEVVVADRIGCDPSPIDPTSREGRLTLSSYVWPDQSWRWAQLRGALAVAAEVPAPVVEAPGSELLRRELVSPSHGLVTVVFHSIMIQYMEPGERNLFVSLLEDAGARATDDAPLAWLRMEPPARHFKWAEHDWEHWARLFPDPPAAGLEDLANVHLTTWPGGGTRLVGRAGYHGRPVHWL